jgi:hypothetical protein
LVAWTICAAGRHGGARRFQLGTRSIGPRCHATKVDPLIAPIIVIGSEKGMAQRTPKTSDPGVRIRPRCRRISRFDSL